MAARILITEPVVDAVIEDLKKDFQVDIGDRGQFNTEKALADVINTYDALLPMLSNPVTAKVIEAGSKLKIIANHAVGYNNIDLEAAEKAGVQVANTPGVLTDACADFTMGLIFSVARKIGPAEKYLRQGKFDGWEPLGFLGAELKDRTLGILGMGRIGRAVVRRANAFGLKIAYHNRNQLSSEAEEELNAIYMPSLEALARQSDILSVHCPLTDQTHHAVNADLIDLMPEDAIIINTARGPVIDEKALADALHSSRLGGAGLDVFEKEPVIHPRLLDAPNCVLTPHMASATQKTRRAIGQLAADAIRAVLQGQAPSSISNLLTA